MTKLAKQSEPLKVEQWDVAKVVPYIRNPRKNAGIPVAKVKASLKEFGWRQPIVVDSEGVIIVGHTRYQAALELGMTEIPVHVAEGLTAAQVKAYRIADNKTGDFAEWDFDLLKLEFADLQELDFGLDLTGFDEADIAAMDDGAGEIGAGDGEPRQTLSDRFGVPPFSVLNAREGWWQDRKRAWLALGIQSKVGRGGNMLGFSEVANRAMKGKAYD